MIQKAFCFVVRYLLALVDCLYLFSIGFLKPSNRDLLLSIIRHFHVSNKDKLQTRLPSIRFCELQPEPLPVRLFETDQVRGNVTLFELSILNQMVALRRPRALFEFGTFDGRTTLNMAGNSPDSARIYTLDLPQESLEKTNYALEKREIELVQKRTSGVRFQQHALARKITQLYGDSAQFDFKPYENKMDFVFVDASHAYDYVLKDSDSALRLLGDEGGVILWHDYGEWDGVTKALDELHKSDEAFCDLRHIKGTTLACLIVPSKNVRPL